MNQILTSKKLSCSVNDDHIYITRYGKIFDVTSGSVGADDRQFTFINAEVGNGERTFVIEHAFTISNVIKAFQNGEKASDHVKMWSVEDFCELITKSYMQATARYYAADELLDLKNNEWLAEREQPIDRDSFMKSIKLQGVEPRKDGILKLWCKADDLFFGHSIIVSLNPDLTLNDAGLA